MSGRGKHPNSLKNLETRWRFEKGLTPWNKGVKTGVVPRSAFTSERTSGESNYNYKHGKSKTREYKTHMQSIRRAQQKNANGTFSLEEWESLKEEYDNKCLCCGRSDVSLVIDHVVPLSKGGRNDISNIQPLCAPCNNRKHTNDDDYRRPRVSIVIPAFNQAEYLADSVESALSQTERCEVIVVNDGSTDGTAGILKDYPVKVIHQTNRGLSSARNTGIMNATGEYILMLDADDMLLDNCVEKLLQIAETTEADAVAPSFKSFGTTNEVVMLTPAPSVEDFKTYNRAGYCALFRTETLKELGGYSPKMTWGYEDYHLWFNLLLRGKRLVTVPEVLWLYRTKEHSMIHVANEHRPELIAQINKDFPELNLV